MVNGGDISKEALVESFSKIKEDILRLNKEIFDLKNDYKVVLEENISLKKQLNNNSIDQDLVKKIVSETVNNLNNNSFNDRLIKKINRNKKILIKNRILDLANKKNLSLSEIKDSIVHEEQLCSKATFYRYVEKLKKRQLIELVEIEDKSIIVRI
ncbi:hypothetical protein JXB41_06155 [Candidatus Woesearchaeota archaeon]|nr:hypothetical protein [Candidatus Woesearchaeota archaeon]